MFPDLANKSGKEATIPQDDERRKPRPKSQNKDPEDQEANDSDEEHGQRKRNATLTIHKNIYETVNSICIYSRKYL